MKRKKGKFKDLMKAIDESEPYINRNTFYG